MSNLLLSTTSEIILKQRRKAILITLIASKKLGLYTQELSTGSNKKVAITYLENSLNLKNKESIRTAIDFMITEGRRATYNILLPHFLTTSTKTKRKELLKERYQGVNLLANCSDNLSDNLGQIEKDNKIRICMEDLQKGVLAWDLSMAILSIRMAFDADYLTEKEAWIFIHKAFGNYYATFKNWDEGNKSFIIGEAMWETAELFKQTLACLYDVLSNHPNEWEQYPL